jgi:hypothetical protein
MVGDHTAFIYLRGVRWAMARALRYGTKTKKVFRALATKATPYVVTATSPLKFLCLSSSTNDGWIYIFNYWLAWTKMCRLNLKSEFEKRLESRQRTVTPAQRLRRFESLDEIEDIKTYKCEQGFYFSEIIAKLKRRFWALRGRTNRYPKSGLGSLALAPQSEAPLSLLLLCRKLLVWSKRWTSICCQFDCCCQIIQQSVK